MEPDLEMLINHGEDTKVEYKRTYKLSEKAVKAELIRDILAMVNAHEQSTGYILIGVDEKTQQLHDAAHLNIDDSDLQSLLNEYTDPPIPFSFFYRKHQGVTLGVIEVRPSTDRFHIVKRNLQDADNKSLLTQGEIWLRSGTKRRRITAWDMKRLKDDHANSQQMQPNLVVTFSNHETEIKQFPIQLPGSENNLSILTGRMSRIYVVEIGFCVYNQGTMAAEKIYVAINLPKGCRNVEPEDNMFLIAARGISERQWHQWSEPKDRDITISGPGLIHGLQHCSDSLYLHFHDPTATYELKWLARAGNMMKPTSGVLHVLPQEKPRQKSPSPESITTEELLKSIGAKSNNAESKDIE